MITSIFINSLGQAIFESCGQALLIYVVLQLFMQLFPAVSSKYRYDVNYLGLIVITCWFLANLVKIYLHNASLPVNSILINSGQSTIGTKAFPTLVQQAEALITTYAKYITGLYIIGLLLQAFKLMGDFMHIHQIRKQKNLSADSIWMAKAGSLSRKLKIAKQVALYFSTRVNVPLTIGYLKPIIIFPVALINNLEMKQAEAILLHELAHIKRHDYLLNILQCVMETLLCFNPFVWLISKTIRQEREYCCDDMVMNEDYNSFSYSKALYLIAQQNSHDYALAMASTGKHQYPLLNRIKRLNNMKTNDSLSKTHLLIIIAVAAIGVLLAWGIPQYGMAKTPVHKSKKTVVYHPDKFSMNTPATAKKENSSTNFPPKAKVIYSDSTIMSMKDSIKHHKKSFKIVVEDDKGNKKEYYTVQELPDSEKTEFMKENPSFDINHISGFEELANIETSPQWKKQALEMNASVEKMTKELGKNNPQWKAQSMAMQRQAEKLKEQFNSPEWKKQTEDMRRQAEKMSRQLNSPEYKKQIEDMQKSAEDMAKKFNSPEYKKQIEDMQKSAEVMAKKFSSPEYKKQIEDMQKSAEDMAKKFNSPEYRKQIEDMQKQIKKEIDKNIQKAEEDSLKSGN